MKDQLMSWLGQHSPWLADLFTSNKYLAAVLILAATVILAALVRIVTLQVLLRLTRRTATAVDDEIIAALGRPLFASVLAVGMAYILRLLTASPASLFAGDALLVTGAVLFWAAAGRRIGMSVIRALARRGGDFRAVQPRTVPLFSMLLNAVLYGGAIYAVLLAWQVDVTAWLASAGIIGLAVGFAAKDTLSNLFAGVFILADAPYKIGDFIVVDDKERGRVTDIGLRSTRILTRDDIEVIVPNAAIANSKIINESGGPHEKERIRVSVGVAYGSDIDQVRKVLLEVAAGAEHLAREPTPRVRLRGLGDSSLQFQLMGWINEPVLRGRALDELYSKVYKRFNAEGIVIPFPQRDVHLRRS